MPDALQRTLRRGPQVSKRDFKSASELLRVDLINAQFDLKDESFSVILVLAGNDLPGGNDVINSLNEWLDARYLDLNIFEHPEPLELERPRFWRYWNALPPAGRISVMAGAWPLHTIVERALGEIDDKQFKRRIACINAFERALIDDGTLLLKFWLHLSREDFQARYRRAFEDPATAWRLTERDWRIFQHYESISDATTQFLDATHSERSQWIVVDSSGQRPRDLLVFTEFRDALTARLRLDAEQRAQPPAAPFKGPGKRVARGHTLQTITHAPSVLKREYRSAVDSLQAQLSMHTRRAREVGRSAVLVFEGWDAAGKGGAIRRITRCMEARNYRVVPIAAPSEEEHARHYLWRFWRHLPRAGRMLIFDRSWYGRVLVERVEGFATRDQWKRAYDEINDFEEQLVEHGILLCKFWLHIDEDEQMRRFNERAQTPFKKYKLTEEDRRNRAKRPLYEEAADDMLALTDTRHAPWTTVAANDKRAARVRVLQTVVQAYEAAI